MSEESIVQIIIALITSGTLGALLALLRRPKKQKDPVTVSEADAAQAHESQRLVLASLNGLSTALAATQRDLKQEQARTNTLERTVTSLQQAHEKDGHLIRTLTTWVRDVHARWAVLRLSETPPPLPDTIQAPHDAGPHS